MLPFGMYGLELSIGDVKRLFSGYGGTVVDEKWFLSAEKEYEAILVRLGGGDHREFWMPVGVHDPRSAFE